MNTYILDTPLSSNDESIYKKKNKTKMYTGISLYRCCLVFNLLRRSPVLNFFKAESKQKQNYW